MMNVYVYVCTRQALCGVWHNTKIPVGERMFRKLDIVQEHTNCKAGLGSSRVI